MTSDNTLRKFAKLKQLDVHGHLWVFDALIEQGCISPTKGIEKLKELDIVNSKLKLPPKECEDRIRKWESMKKN